MISKFFKKYLRRVVVLALVVTMVIPNVLFVQPAVVFGAVSHTWYQSSWIGGVGTVAPFPVHPTNQTGWTKFYSKDTRITTGTDITLAPTPGFVTQTTDVDFGAGNLANTVVSGSGTAAEVRLTQQPWLIGWDFRKPITIDHTKVDADLTHFPVMVRLTAANFNFANARPDGFDIRFTASDGTTLLAYERERHNAAANIAEYWVKIPSVSATAPTIFYIYYGNATATDGANPTAVWDTNTMARWPLKEDPTGGTGAIKDSTVNANHGTSGGAMTSADSVEGKIGKALDFDGVNDRVDAGDIGSVSDFTIELWFFSRSVENWRNLFHTHFPASGSSNIGVRVEQYTGGLLKVGVSADNVWRSHDIISTLTKNQWYHLVIVGDNANSRVYAYLDAVEKLNAIHTSFPTSFPTLNIGRGFSTAPARHFKGLIDEVRISNIARSPAWIRASFNSGNNTLLAVGAEEVLLYHSSGTFISSAIDTGQNSNFITLGFAIAETGGTDLKFQLRSATTKAGLSAATWYGPTGIADFYTAIGTAINPIHNGHRWIQYKALFSTTDTLITPTLSDITINYQFYPASASLISSPFNTMNLQTGLADIRWTETLPHGTQVRFQLRTSPDNINWTSWMGPDGTIDSCFTVSTGGEKIPFALSDGIDDQWIQYRVLLRTLDASVTPTLSAVTFEHKDMSTPVSPVNVRVTNLDSAFAFDGAVGVHNDDLDGDGNQDILGAAFHADEIAWWQNDGGGTFTKFIIDSAFDGAEDVHSADFDGDGNMDVLGAAYTAGKVAWWRNDGTGNFTKFIIDSAFDGAEDISSADLDGDGDQDILNNTSKNQPTAA